MEKQAAETSRQRRAAQIMAAERKRRRRTRIGSIAVGAVLVVLVVMVGVKLATKSTPKGSVAAPGSESTPVTAAVLKQVATVPSSVLNKVGVGLMTTPPLWLPHGQPLTEGGKPRLLYVGAEYCPFCAAERWAVVVALSRFGTFTGLRETHSSPTDIYPNTQTLSFHGSRYSSRYLAFRGYETANVDEKPLETLSSQDQQIFTKYDAPPYVEGGIPFLYYGGKALSDGANYGPNLLAGLTQTQIATQLHNPTSKVARAVDGSANTVTAAICRMTNNKPSNVCNDSGVKAAAAKITPAP